MLPGQFLADSTDLGLGQFREMDLFASSDQFGPGSPGMAVTELQTAFRRGIPSIGFGIAQEKVIRADAGAVVAAVQDEGAGRDRPAGYLPGESMGQGASP